MQLFCCNFIIREEMNLASQSLALRQDSVELECIEKDVDQQTPHSADALLHRGPPQLTRLTSSDQDDDLDFDATAPDHDDDDEEEEEVAGLVYKRL